MTTLRCSEYCKGKILTTLKLENKGLAEGTLRNLSFNLKHLAAQANLDDPESVKDYIAKKACANSRKMKLAKAYNNFALAKGLNGQNQTISTKENFAGFQQPSKLTN